MASLAYGLFQLACSSSSEPVTSSNVPTDTTAPPGESPPAAVDCADGAYKTAQRACESFPTLTMARATSVIAPIRDHHATTVIETSTGPYLYVLGGTDDWRVLHDDAQRARINDDGTLGSFENAGKLPAPRAGHCMVKVKDRLLLAGGIVPAGGSMGVSASSVLVRIGADGKITDAVPGPELPKGVMHLSCEVQGDYVYALGGRGANSKSTTLSARARINADGTLGAFEAQTPLSPDRSHHASFIREKRIYVMGGLTGDPTSAYTDRADVLMAGIGDDGALGAWSPAGKLPTALGVSSAALYKDAVYTVGGLEGDGFTDKIRRATFNDDGTLGAFATLATRLPGARGHVHQTPIWKSTMFSVGGKDDTQASLGTVDIGRFL